MEVSPGFHTKIQSRNIWIAAKMESRPKRKISEQQDPLFVRQVKLCRINITLTRVCCRTNITLTHVFCRTNITLIHVFCRTNITLTHVFCLFMSSMKYDFNTWQLSCTLVWDNNAEFTPGFQWGWCYSIFSFMCMLCRSLFVFLFFF